MIKHRVFVAINIPDDIKRKLFEIQQKWSGLPVRWTKRNSLHLTISFLGYVDSEDLYRICEITREVAKNHQSFFCSFKKVMFGPPAKTPRMIWVVGEKSTEATKIKQELEKEFSLESSINFAPEDRSFSPHITLARIKMGEWRTLKEVPKIDEEFSFDFSVNSMEVMESHLLGDGAEYVVLESAPLGE